MLDDDLSDIFDNTDEFAKQATYTPSLYPHGSPNTQTINVIHDYDFVGEFNAENLVPVIMCRTSDAPNVARGDHLTVAGFDFIVANVDKGGSGLTHLQLEKI